jgi:hypothetical protein
MYAAADEKDYTTVVTKIIENHFFSFGIFMFDRKDDITSPRDTFDLVDAFDKIDDGAFLEINDKVDIGVTEASVFEEEREIGVDDGVTVNPDRAKCLGDGAL